MGVAISLVKQLYYLIGDLLGHYSGGQNVSGNVQLGVGGVQHSIDTSLTDGDGGRGEAHIQTGENRDDVIGHLKNDHGAGGDAAGRGQNDVTRGQSDVPNRQHDTGRDSNSADAEDRSPPGPPGLLEPSPPDFMGFMGPAGPAGTCQCSHPGVQTRRNLVVCLDGTANQFGEKSSNIVELYSRLVKDDSQLAYYSSGIGTYVKEDRKSTFRHWKQAVDSAVDQAIATSFEEIVHHAYRWLSDNYQRGDKIFLFGFSRGAYQARVIAGMIEKVGLLQKGNIDQINFAYSLYVKSTQSGGRDREERERGPVPDQDEVSTHERLGTESRQKIDKQNPFMTNPKNGKSSAKSNGSARQQDHASSPADLFKDTFSVSGARVHFVGAWDTVSSVGWIRGPSLPETTTGMSHVCVFRHALALDELRVKFLPEFANGGKGPLDGQNNIKEVWFAGSHSDIGGGNLPNANLENYGPALRWMTYEATLSGLRIVLRIPFHNGLSSSESLPPTRPMNRRWKILEYLPITRLSYTENVNPENTKRWPPHCSSPRTVMSGQLIHASVFCDPQKYRPRAQFTDNTLWDMGAIQRGGRMEEDPYLKAEGIVRKCLLNAASAAHRKELVEMTAPGGICNRSFAEVPRAAEALFRVLEAIQEEKNAADIVNRTNDSAIRQGSDATGLVQRTIRACLRVLSLFHTFPQTEEPQIRLELDKRLAVATVDDHETILDIVPIRNVFGIGLVATIERFGTDAFASFPLDGRIVAGSGDKIRTWDPYAGAEATWTKHDQPIKCISIAPEPAASAWEVASCSGKTIGLWGKTHQLRAVSRFIESGHKDEICGVALSPNGRRVVTASRDKTLEVWFFDGAFEGPEQQGPLCRPLVLSGHSKSVRSVAYSSHPRHMIASGSDDCTVRIWNVESGATVQELTGHTAPVLTVAYSPDGGHVVSGSADGTIRIWYTSNVATPLILKGGFGSVRSVAYANHRDYFASGSNDGKVRVWNARTGRTMQKSVYRHDNHVTFVAFKYLGGDTYLVSGGEDKVNVWRLGMVDHKKSPFLSGIKSDA